MLNNKKNEFLFNDCPCDKVKNVLEDIKFLDKIFRMKKKCRIAPIHNFKNLRR